MSKSEPENGWIQTRSGLKFDLLNPDPDLIRVEDIACALSRECRYTGHTKKFWSVAQHSVIVSKVCKPEDALWGLLHDASEAYLRDLPRPMKRLPVFDVYRFMEERMMKAVCDRFRLPYSMPQSVKDADLDLLITESEQLMRPLHPDWHYREANGYKALNITLRPVGPVAAERMFLKRFTQLWTGGE